LVLTTLEESVSWDIGENWLNRVNTKTKQTIIFKLSLTQSVSPCVCRNRLAYIRINNSKKVKVAHTATSNIKSTATSNIKSTATSNNTSLILQHQVTAKTKAMLTQQHHFTVTTTMLLPQHHATPLTATTMLLPQDHVTTQQL